MGYEIVVWLIIEVVLCILLFLFLREEETRILILRHFKRCDIHVSLRECPIKTTICLLSYIFLLYLSFSKYNKLIVHSHVLLEMKNYNRDYGLKNNILNHINSLPHSLNPLQLKVGLTTWTTRLSLTLWYLCEEIKMQEYLFDVFFIDIFVSRELCQNKLTHFPRKM